MSARENSRKGKLHGLSLRVPTSTVSVVDLVVDLEKPASIETVNAALRSTADGNLSGILVYCDEPLVSSDFRGNAAPLSTARQPS